jgi:AP2-associated kinase
VENILLHEKIFKLCDFGSASTDTVDFATVSKLEASRHEETFEKNTTLMYRPPEMSDPYMKYEVNTKVDVWMLGCVLYTMCFYIHPFQDASKLAIV